MDNRIPSVIKDFIKSEPNGDGVDFLSFNDWLSKRENESQDWMVIAKSYRKDDYEDYYTFSCLIQANDKSLKKFLSNCHWYINSEFGIPRKYQTPYVGESYDDGIKAKKDGVIYHPFTFHRHFNGYIPDRFELIDHFLLYYNCFWVEDKKEYQAIDDDGEIKTIVKYIKTETEETFLVDTHTLKDYLAVRNLSLARFHDHRRRSKKDISTFLKRDLETYKLTNDNSYLELDLRSDIFQFNDVKSASRLLGKDIVKSYSKPKSHKWSENIYTKEFLEFIIDRDENGKEVKSNCDPEILSNYFTDKGTPHFLTPVYFKRELLQKYFAEPKKYIVSELSVEYLSFWGIEISTTNENLIQVYLGDIGRSLPYNEQLHWRQYNVVPKGKIAEHRYKRDFLVEQAFPEIEEAPITHFKETFELVQKQFKLYCGHVLFKELAKDDQHLYSTLHIPLTDEWKEFDEQILALAKITSDSFNNEILKNLTGKKIGDNDKNGKPIKGLLALFYEFLNKIILDDEYRDSLIQPFNMLQALRSSSVAHRKSKELESALVKYGLKELSNEQRFKHIIIELIKSMKSIIIELK
jgi:hypothetical protein